MDRLCSLDFDQLPFTLDINFGNKLVEPLIPNIPSVYGSQTVPTITGEFISFTIESNQLPKLDEWFDKQSVLVKLCHFHQATIVLGKTGRYVKAVPNCATPQTLLFYSEGLPAKTHYPHVHFNGVLNGNAPVASIGLGGILTPFWLNISPKETDYTYETNGNLITVDPIPWLVVPRDVTQFRV